MTRPVIHDSRTPHKLFLLLAGALGGFLGLVFPKAHGASIADAFPGHTQLIWYAGLFLGCTVSLAGIGKRGITGYLVEQAGMFLLTGIMISFAVAAIAHTGTSAVPAALILTGFGVANAVRAWHIHQDLRKVRHYLTGLAEDRGARE